VSYIGRVTAGEKRSPARSALAAGPFSAVLVACLLAGCGGGSPQGDKVAQPPLPTVTAPAGVTTTQASQASAPTTDGRQPGTTTKQTASASDQSAPAACAGISRQQCKALAGQQPRSGKPGKTLRTSRDCLSRFTREQCEAMAKAQQGSPGKAIRTPEDCLQVFTREQCEAMYGQQH
jgi:hypothetical protein